jgi:hypothetical protein
MPQTVQFFGVEAVMPPGSKGVLWVTAAGVPHLLNQENEAVLNCERCMEFFASTACMRWRDVMESRPADSDRYFYAKERYGAWKKIRDIAIRKQKEG